MDALGRLLTICRGLGGQGLGCLAACACFLACAVPRQNYVTSALPDLTARDAGTEARADAGPVARKPVVVNDITWPEEVRTLATLDGRAIIAAHVAMQHLRERIAKEDKRYAGHCNYSPKAMDVIVGEGGGMYIVRINRRVDRCERASASFNAAVDWVELYAVSMDGQVLARYPAYD